MILLGFLMINSKLSSLVCSESISLYETNFTSGPVRTFISSTPETRTITNDPFFAGIQYTQALTTACAKTLRCLDQHKVTHLEEHNTTVLHILRGGLNFGLREALNSAFNFNYHPAAFISAQRARKTNNPDEWIITEDSYKKVHLRENSDLVFGDVVATGTSLEHALREVARISATAQKNIRSIIFFTIGGSRSHEIVSNVATELKELNPQFAGATVVYFEGIFAVPSIQSPLTIKLDGTDLVRRDALMAPEFIASQYEQPSFPIERCTIYDAGSRAFDFEEYIEDVTEYWQQVLSLAQNGIAYSTFLAERFPELDIKKFPGADLAKVAHQQLAKANSICRCKNL